VQQVAATNLHLVSHHSKVHPVALMPLIAWWKSEWICHWDPEASHSRSTEALLLALKCSYGMVGSTGKDMEISEI